MAQKKEKAAFLAHVSAARDEEHDAAAQRALLEGQEASRNRAKAMMSTQRSVELSMDGELYT